MKLYEIQSEIAALLAATDDGELPPDAEARLDGLQMQLEEKADNICRLIRQREAEQAGYAEEADRLIRLADAARRDYERLKDYLRRTLTGLGLKRLDTALFKLSACKNSQPSVLLADSAEVPPQYSRVKVELDRKAVVEAWRDGLTLPEGLTVEVGEHLRIR